MRRGRAWRIATGAMLLAAGASGLLPPATKSLTLVLSGILVGASLARGSAPALSVPSRLAELPASPIVPFVAPMPRLLIVPERLLTHESRERKVAVLALMLFLGACGLFLYPWLTHQNSPLLQASSGGYVPGNTLGKPIAPKVDPQLHVVALGQQFALSRARITVSAASVCEAGGNALIEVPAAIQRLSAGVAISEPEYQLLDAQGVPHQPVGTVPLDRPAGSAQHAVPPPVIYREAIDFQLPAVSVSGALKLQAVLASGSGPEYRVTVARAGHPTTSPSGGKATCVSPGGQGV